MPNYTKTCSFLHAHYTDTLKVVEKFVKNLFYGEKHSFIEWTLLGNSNVYQQYMLLKLRKHILKYTQNKYHVHLLSSFKHLKLPYLSLYGKCLYLHDSYIIKFDFMNYAFVKLVVAW